MKNKYILIILALIVVGAGAYLVVAKKVGVGNSGGNKNTVNLYYYNLTEDRKIADYVPCDPKAVLPVEREISNDVDRVQETVKLLFGGNLVDSEKVQGFEPKISNTFSLKQVSLENGVLTVEVGLLPGKFYAGSCLTTIFGTELNQTIKQFPEIREVQLEPKNLFNEGDI